jgi:hypothetical protein
MMTLLFFALAAQTPARADLIVSNLDSPLIGGATGRIGDGSLNGTISSQATRFDTDAQAYTLTEVIARIGGRVGTIAGFAHLRLHNPVANAPLGGPAGLIGSFAFPDDVPTGPPQDVPFTPLGTITLAPNSSYWFVLGDTNPGTYYQWVFPGNSVSTGPGQIPDRYAFSRDSENTWTAFTDEPYLMSVSGTPVPEPASIFVAATAVAVAVVPGRLRRRRNVGPRMKRGRGPLAPP